MKKSLPVFIFFILSNVGIGKVPPPAEVPPVPHRDVIGKDAPKAEAVLQALEDILHHKSLPAITGNEGYEIATLRCRDLWVPIAPQGYDCEFDYRIGSGGGFTSVTVKDEASSNLAENLFAKLNDAGATYYDDPAHGAFMTLKKIISTSNELHFDDYSNYHPPPQPNVTVTGLSAKNVLDALDAAGIDDGDGSLLLICTSFDNALKCGYQLHHKPGPSLASGASERLWRSVKEAAVASGFRPPWKGTLDEMTVFNANNFTFDGLKLGLLLNAGNAKPPKPPPHPTRRK